MEISDTIWLIKANLRTVPLNQSGPKIPLFLFVDREHPDRSYKTEAINVTSCYQLHLHYGIKADRRRLFLYNMQRSGIRNLPLETWKLLGSGNYWLSESKFENNRQEIAGV